jgi:release factor glutamine methyltransferase
MYASLLASGIRRLTAAGLPDPVGDAQLLMAQVGNGGTSPDGENLGEHFHELIARRAKFEPMQYLTGRATFMGMQLDVTRAVHLPRPAMETMVTAASHVVRQLAEAAANRLVTVCDVGTGSAALALGLARTQPLARPILAIDVSSPAIEVARGNCARYDERRQVVLRKGSLLSGINDRIDLVMANLPFLTPRSLQSMEPDLAQHEPAIAIMGTGEAGWDLQESLLRQAAERDVPPSATFVTLHVSQREHARLIAAEIFPGFDIEFAPIRPGWSEFLAVTSRR